MVWNHRVMLRDYGRGYKSLEIYEVYYEKEKDGNLNIIGSTQDPINPYADTEEGLDVLKIVVKRMIDCLNKPVLDYETRKEVSEDVLASLVVKYGKGP